MIDGAIQKKVLIMAGGTGGHVFPALSTARFLKKEGVEVEWLGTRQGMESRLVESEGIPMHHITISGLRGKGVLRKLLGPIFILRALWQSCLRLREAKPDCVLGMGGYVTGPGGIAAWLLRKPLVIHEQNAIAGFTNLMLMPFASIVMEAFPGSFVRKKGLDGGLISRWAARKADVVQVVGNPVREEITHMPEPDERMRTDGPLKILVIGGSLGAIAINRVVPAMLACFDEGERPEVWHQCGDRNLEETRELYRDAGIALGERARVDKFIDDMAVAYNWADLVICRSGALTVWEIASAGLASILVPYPHAVDDHQTENARFLSDAMAARMIPEAVLSVEKLYATVNDMKNDRDELITMARKARGLARPDAREVVGKLCLGVCNG